MSNMEMIEQQMASIGFVRVIAGHKMEVWENKEHSWIASFNFYADGVYIGEYDYSIEDEEHSGHIYSTEMPADVLRAIGNCDDLYRIIWERE